MSTKLVVLKVLETSDFSWDSNLDRVQLKRNNQIRDAINKAARFIINRCLADGVGNIIIGWNEGQKNGSY